MCAPRCRAPTHALLPLHHFIKKVPEGDDADNRNGASDGTSYKAKKRAELQQTAENKDVWSTLFVRSDTAIGVIAEQMGLGKSDILDRESSGSMVRWLVVWLGACVRACVRVRCGLLVGVA